jgi:ribosomal protein S10
MNPTLQSILAEVQAIDTTNLDSVVASIAQVVTDLQTLIAVPVAVDPIVTIVTTTASGVVETFVPQVV